ncbi:RNA polymerase III subunit E [Homo sapiens]|uniref:RNA polymerase III subunit E n=1 Tax=Homo sapiens TaxID=9606 RepID=H3BS41_HUMAN|nr:RNA polymerase III subunit E [Homo sapiens]KAI4054003.1 RNA polymerase III subunit E [Homo sapiens]
MANEEDDPVVQEIDVYLAKSLAEKLYLFQYPVRPASMTYDDIPHLSAKIKPKQQKQRGADCAERGRGLRRRDQHVFLEADGQADLLLFPDHQ